MISRQNTCSCVHRSAAVKCRKRSMPVSLRKIEFIRPKVKAYFSCFLYLKLRIKRLIEESHNPNRAEINFKQYE